MSKPVLPTKHRRKGFESVRKGSCTANARPLFFEKELFYCKLTVGFRRGNLQLLVSFGAVGSWSFCALKKAFLYQVALHESKNRLYRESKIFSSAENIANFTQSHFFTHKNFFCTNLSLLLSKATLFHPPPPISTSLNLLSTKNTAVLLQSALILCCKAGASHRFKSLPAIPGEVAAFRKTGYLMNGSNFRKNHVSTGDLNRGSQGFAPRAFWLLFARCKK